jgi:hypothetical protein
VNCDMEGNDLPLFQGLMLIFLVVTTYGLPCVVFISIEVQNVRTEVPTAGKMQSRSDSPVPGVQPNSAAPDHRQ